MGEYRGNAKIIEGTGRFANASGHINWHYFWNHCSTGQAWVTPGTDVRAQLK